MRIVRQQFDETAQRQKRAVEDQRAAAALAQFAVAIKFDRKPGQFVLPRCFAWCDGVTGSNQQCAMDAMGGDCVRGCEFPAGKNRLHNLITERDPFDAIEMCIRDSDATVTGGPPKRWATCLTGRRISILETGARFRPDRAPLSGGCRRYSNRRAMSSSGMPETFVVQLSPCLLYTSRCV